MNTKLLGLALHLFVMSWLSIVAMFITVKLLTKGFCG